MSPGDWRDGGGFLDWRGQRIFHRMQGRGETVLLIHGFPTSSWDWAPLWPRLCEHFRVVALDLIGFGFSAKPQRFNYSIGAQADLVEAVLAHTGTSRCRLIAHDYGVSVAQELLARQLDGTSPVHLEGICFLNGGLFPETHRPVPVQTLLASPVGPLLARWMTYRTFAANMRRICVRPLDDGELRGMWRLLEENNGKLVIPKLIGYMAERRRQRERWVGALLHSDVSLRLIAGMDDPVSGAHMVARYRELVPQSDVVELAGVGHYPQLEAPEAVLSAVLEAFARSHTPHPRNFRAKP